MQNYIPLDRKFVKVDARSQDGEHDDFLLGFEYSSEFGNSWSDILKNPCTIILAEAGSGKTTEFHAQTEQLRREGKPAFFCRLEILAEESLEDALGIGRRQEFQAWKDSNAHGYFFLDSVDEARLTSLRAFEMAIIHFVKAVELCRKRLTVVISTRPHEWLAQSDPAMLERRLAFSEENSPVEVVQMKPLNPGQVKIFAGAKGVDDTDGFIQAINLEDANAFATRPGDLPGLIDIWKSNNRIGPYSKVVSRDITLKLSEENPNHSSASPISPARARAGAEVLAAAASLTKRRAILLPDQPVDDALRRKCIDPQEALPDWNPDEIRSLLGRALFDEALYGSVGFHHRTEREYLTACWFKKLLPQQNRRNMEGVFFVKPYGVLPEVVAPSLRPIVGWLAGWDAGIRNRAVRIDPGILLEHGDPSSLDVGTRESLLRNFAKRSKDRNNTPLNLHVREVRRLADKRLVKVMHELLETYRGHGNVRNLLLRVIGEGGIPGCGQLASTFATDTKVGPYTRSVAVQAVGLAGSPDDQHRLARQIISQASSLERRIISAAIKSLWPKTLTDQDVLLLLKQTSEPNELVFDNLKYVVSQIPEQISNVDQTQTFLSDTLEIVSQPPFHDDRLCRISQKYDWLLSLLWVLAEKLRRLHPAPENVPEFLEAISLCDRSRHYVPKYRYRRAMDDEIARLLSDNAKVRRKLVWHECAQARRLKEKPVTDYRPVFLLPDVLLYPGEDDYYLRELRERQDPEDKRVALSGLTAMYGASQNPDLLQHIKNAVSGNPVLEDELARKLTPSQKQLEIKEHRSRSAAQRRQQERKKAEERQNWIKGLKADPNKVGDWNNAFRLLREIEGKTRAAVQDRLTASRWECLIPEFGEEVARKFRDFCQAFWRRYTPSMRPDNSEKSQSIPDALTVGPIGLSGLAIEAENSETWADQLTDEEAELATQYALCELKDFPEWFGCFLQAKPEPVKKVLREEIEWELSTFLPDDVSPYVLGRLDNTNNLHLADLLRDDIAAILATKADVPVKPLTKALAIILRNATPLSQAFQNSVARHAETVSAEQQKALWLSALLCLDAEHALAIMDPWVNTVSAEQQKALWLSALLCLDAEHALTIMDSWINSGTGQDGERRVSLIINVLWGGDWGYDGFTSQHSSYGKPEFLLRLLKIVYSHVRPEDDIRHDARRQLLRLLCDIPGKPAYDALIRLSESQPPGNSKDVLLNLADSHAENDAARQQEWTAAQVAEFECDAEKNPKTQQDLFDIAVSRLNAIKFDLEEGDDSEASLWQKADDETELRLVIANRLKLISAGKYTIASEEELADRSQTDIRLHHPNIDAPIPIEVKIAGKWSANELRERMENQLVGQYMREAQYGIFLLINQGNKQFWQPEPSRRLAFSDLVQWLQDESRTLLKKHGHVQNLEVAGIDLTKRAGGDLVR